MTRVGAAALLVLALSGCGTRKPPSDNRFPLTYHCPTSPSAPVIDGRINEPAWSVAPWTSQFVDILGPDQLPPQWTTRAKMMWDNKFLYIAAELQEPHVWASLTNRDDIVYRDNDFEVFIDPDGDSKMYVEVEINAFGTILDLFMVKPYNSGGRAMLDWDFKGMKTGVAIQGSLNDPGDVDQGWSVEMALPWRGFLPAYPPKVPPSRGDNWRINFSRVQWQHRIVGKRYERIPNRREDNWVWSPQSVVNMHVPQHWGHLIFE